MQLDAMRETFQIQVPGLPLCRQAGRGGKMWLLGETNDVETKAPPVTVMRLLGMSQDATFSSSAASVVRRGVNGENGQSLRF